MFFDKTGAIHQALIPIKIFWLISRHRSDWRRKNLHNRTRAVNVFPLGQVWVGKDTYGDLNVYSFGGG